MITELIKVLQHIFPELTAEEVADAIWLALQMDTSASILMSSEGDDKISSTDNTGTPSKQSDYEKFSHPPVTSGLYLGSLQENREDSQQFGTLPFRTPAALALPGSLAIARALRPFMRRVPLLTHFVLNEDATAERIAEEGLWIPVLDHALTRWLDIALVIDRGTSMTIWQQTAAELYLLLARQGAFRDVRIWELDTNHHDKVFLYAGTDSSISNRPARSERELIDTGGHRLILVLTDCVSPAWHSGKVVEVLAKWGQYNSVTLIQVLSQRLWSRTALSAATSVRLHASAPGIPNIQFNVQSTNIWNYEDEDVQPSLPIPIVTLEPEPLAAWSRVVARAEDKWIPGYMFATNPLEIIESDEQINNIVQEETAPEKKSANERVQRFRANASPTARRLAGLLATVPVSLPIIRLIQQTMLLESRQVHIAEVFLGGLLEVISVNSHTLDPEAIQYDFANGVREVLLNSVSISDKARVLSEISNFIESKYGQALDFQALIANPLIREGVSISKESKPFAIIASKVLRRFGGDYVSLADWIETVASEVPDQEQPGSQSAGISIDSLHKEVRQTEIQEKDVAFPQQEIANGSATYGSLEQGTSREQDTEQPSLLAQSQSPSREKTFINETSIKELADFLKFRKNQGQRVGLFLGHRTGILYNGTLYEALKDRMTTTENFSRLLKPNIPIPHDKLVHHIQLFADLPPSAKFKECYGFLDKHFSENGIHSILSQALKQSPYREGTHEQIFTATDEKAFFRREDELIAKLIKAEFFDTILTTNFDTLLEDACNSLGMNEPSDYRLFICGSDDSKTLGKRSKYGQIIKIFGDFESLNYKTVGNEFNIEADQQIKKFLESEMAKDIVVLGYDPSWDKPVERAFQKTGGMIWYINEEQPSPNTHMTHILNNRYGKFVGGGPEWNYSSFLQTLSNRMEEKVSQELEIKSPLPAVSSPDSMRKKAFISYSHQDRAYMQRLRVHLAGYLHKNDDALNIICDDVWDDTTIPIGANWQEELENALRQTKVAVCLVSAGFLGSDFIREKELPVLYEAARANQVQIVSVIIGYSAFEDSFLSNYQTINSPDEPLVIMTRHVREAIWAELAKYIFTVLGA